MTIFPGDKSNLTAKTAFMVIFLLFSIPSFTQIILNEGSNKNYSTIADEDGEFEDWVEYICTTDRLEHPSFYDPVLLGWRIKYCFESLHLQPVLPM